MLLSAVCGLLLTYSPVVRADDPSIDATSTASDDQVNRQIQEKQDQLRQIESALQEQQSSTQQTNDALSSLKDELAILDNRIQEKKLTLDQTNQEIALANLELEQRQKQIDQSNTEIDQRRALIATLLRRIQEADSVQSWEVFLTHPTLSDFFARAEQMRELEGHLSSTTEALQGAQQDLQSRQAAQEAQRQTLADERTQAQRDELAFESERDAKLSLLDETQGTQDRFQRLLDALRSEEQLQTSGIADLQQHLKNPSSALGADSDTAQTLSWPIDVTRGISAAFHDPNYPFRELFQHPGIDLPTNVGTPVHAAASGYVAWTRTGREYGNYIMIIHANGLATIYAHLSQFEVQPNTYVVRGEEIGLSGGEPGAPGAGLSTGPHVHFEVRQNGIPVNPENFLPPLDGGQ